MSAFRKILFPCALLVVGGACRVAQHEPQSAASGTGVTSGNSGGSGGSQGGAGGSGRAGPKCVAPEPPGLGQDFLLGTLRASLIDEQGQPAANILCSLCGVNLCASPVATDAKGAVTLKGPGAVQVDARFNVGYDGRGVAKMAALIPKTPDFDFGTVRVLRLPPFSGGAPLAAGNPAVSGGVTLTPPANAVVAFDVLLFDTAEQRFVAALMDIRKVNPAELPAVEPKLGLEVLIGTGPLGTAICPAAALRFTNLAGWAAGTAVDIYMNGTDTFENYAPYGQWSIIAQATVDPDGATVTTAAGSGIEKLGTFGARPKP